MCGVACGVKGYHAKSHNERATPQILHNLVPFVLPIFSVTESTMHISLQSSLEERFFMELH